MIHTCVILLDLISTYHASVWRRVHFCGRSLYIRLYINAKMCKKFSLKQTDWKDLFGVFVWLRQIYLKASMSCWHLRNASNVLFCPYWCMTLTLIKPTGVRLVERRNHRNVWVLSVCLKEVEGLQCSQSDSLTIYQYFARRRIYFCFGTEEDIISQIAGMFC